MGDNTIHYSGHVRMMGAVQPFISGAISKTVNMPEDVSVEDVEQLHIDAWRMGLKAVAIYRDNCKVAQPLSGKKNKVEEKDTPDVMHTTVEKVLAGQKRSLPRRRNGHSYKFRIGNLKGFVTVNEFEDGKPGEVFINVSKEG